MITGEQVALAARVCRNIRALQPKWVAYYPDDASEVHIPRRELLALVAVAEAAGAAGDACLLAACQDAAGHLDDHIEGLAADGLDRQASHVGEALGRLRAAIAKATGVPLTQD